MAWVLLDSLLLGNPASALTKALNDSGLGDQVIGHGSEHSLRQPMYVRFVVTFCLSVVVHRTNCVVWIEPSPPHHHHNSLVLCRYCVGLSGVAEENVERVEELIVDVLSHHAEHGFEKDHLEATVNSLRFMIREPPRNGYGLPLMLNALPYWIHHGYDQPGKSTTCLFSLVASHRHVRDCLLHIVALLPQRPCGPVLL